MLSDDDLMLMRSDVTSEVCAVRRGELGPGRVIERLRTYERTARDVGMEPQTVQVILSGRRLLGDLPKHGSKRRAASEPMKKWNGVTLPAVG